MGISSRQKKAICNQGITKEETAPPPPTLAGGFNSLLDCVHRQVLMTTLGFCLGYYIKRYSNYYYAERDRELFSYIKHHPEDFVEKEPRKVGEILEDFTPTR
uniref:NADH dehydrogenase [ubiquinone] 1 subunit C2 n=1 Tax=Pseudonaja textilis TaxID=8673 RepID=A0A670ZHV2_PSETE